jgi:hypothetical protein
LTGGFILVVLDEDALVGDRRKFRASVLLAQKCAYIEFIVGYVF